MVEQEQKLITNWLKLLLIWTGGVEAKVQAIWKSQHRKAKVTSNQTTSYIRTQWQTKAEKHIKYVSKWSLENIFRNLQRNCERSLGTKEANQKPSTSKEMQELSSKQKKLRDEAESNQN